MKTTFHKASPADAAAIHSIYVYYVENTVTTFTTANRTPQEFATKIERSPYPFVVARYGGQPVGFAYADRSRPHDAYLWNVELTIYLHPEAPKRQGIGTGLYEILLEVLARQGFQNAYAVIAADNTGSIRFHQRFGFDHVVTFPKMSYKFGEWHDVVWMHRALARQDADSPLALPLPFRKYIALDGQPPASAHTHLNQKEAD